MGNFWEMFKEFDSLKNKKTRETRLFEKNDSENAGESLENSAQGAESSEDSTTPEDAKMDVVAMFSMLTKGDNTQVEDSNPDGMETYQNTSNKALEELMEAETRMKEAEIGCVKDSSQEQSTPCTSRWDIKKVKDLDPTKVLINEEKARLENSLTSIKEENEQDLIEYEKPIGDEIDESVLVNGVFLEVCRCSKCEQKGYKELHFVGHSDEDPPDVEKIELPLELVEGPQEYPDPQEAQEEAIQVSIDPETFPAISEALNSMAIDGGNTEDVDLENKNDQNSEVVSDIFGNDFDPSKFAASSDFQTTEISDSDDSEDSTDSDEDDCDLVEDQIEVLIDTLFPNLKHVITKSRNLHYLKAEDVDVKNTDFSLQAMALSSDDENDSEYDNIKDSHDNISMPMDIESGLKPEFPQPCVIGSNEESTNLSKASSHPQVLYPDVIVVKRPKRPVPRPRSLPVPAPRTKFLNKNPDSGNEVEGSKFSDKTETDDNDEKQSEVTQTEDGTQLQTQPEDYSAAAGNRGLMLWSKDSEDDIDMTNPPKKILGQFLLEEIPDNYPSEKDLKSPDTESHHTLSDYAILKSEESKTRGFKKLKRAFRDFFKTIKRTTSRRTFRKFRMTSRKSTSSKNSNEPEADKTASDVDKEDPEGATPQTTKPSDPSRPTTNDLGARPKQPPPKPPRSRLSQLIVEENFNIEVGPKSYIRHENPEHIEVPMKRRSRPSTMEQEQLQRMETKVKKHHLLYLRQKYREEREKTKQKTKEIELLTKELEELRTEFMRRHNLTEDSLTVVSLDDESDQQVLDKVDDDTNQGKPPETAEDTPDVMDNDQQDKSNDSCQPGENLNGASNGQNDDENDIEDLTENFSHFYITREKNKSCSIS
nr:hypothetical protein MACL_00001314 [Theileria orientalis]